MYIVNPKRAKRSKKRIWRNYMGSSLLTTKKTYNFSVLTYYSSNSIWEGWTWSLPWPANRRPGKCAVRTVPTPVTGGGTPAQSTSGTAASIARIPSPPKQTSVPPVQKRINKIMIRRAYFLIGRKGYLFYNISEKNINKRWNGFSFYYIVYLKEFTTNP